jgi:hypothetical protein
MRWRLSSIRRWLAATPSARPEADYIDRDECCDAMVLRTQRDANPYAGDATSVFVGLQAELSSRAAIFLRPSGSSLEGSMPRSGPAPDTRSPSSTRAVRAAWPPAPGPQAPGRARRRRLPRFRALVARAAQQRLVFAALMAPPAAMARATAAYAAGGATGGGRGGRGLASLLQLGFVPAPGEAPEPPDGSPGLRVRGQLISPPRGIVSNQLAV